MTHREGVTMRRELRIARARSWHAEGRRRTKGAVWPELSDT
jgi:hypothetical protein